MLFVCHVPLQAVKAGRAVHGHVAGQPTPKSKLYSDVEAAMPVAASSRTAALPAARPAAVIPPVISIRDGDAAVDMELDGPLLDTPEPDVQPEAPSSTDPAAALAPSATSASAPVAPPEVLSLQKPADICTECVICLGLGEKDFPTEGKPAEISHRLSTDCRALGALPTRGGDLANHPVRKDAKTSRKNCFRDVRPKLKAADNVPALAMYAKVRNNLRRYL